MKFEEYLKDIFMLSYDGLDDDAPEKFENWLTYLDIEDWLSYGDDFAKSKK